MVVALAKQAGEAEAEYLLVLCAWWNMDIVLHIDINKPQEGTTIAQFINTLNCKQINWFN
jgi:hypothetical protein